VRQLHILNAWCQKHNLRCALPPAGMSRLTARTAHTHACWHVLDGNGMNAWSVLRQSRLDGNDPHRPACIESLRGRSMTPTITHRVAQDMSAFSFVTDEHFESDLYPI
jgi:hypothetical protein